MRRSLPVRDLAGLLIALAALVWAWPLWWLLLTFWSVDGQEPDAARLLRAAPEAMIRPARVPPLVPDVALRVLTRASKRTLGTADNAYERQLTRAGWAVVERLGSVSRWHQAGGTVVENRVGDTLTLECKRFSRWFDVCDVRVLPFSSP